MTREERLIIRLDYLSEKREREVIQRSESLGLRVCYVWVQFV